MPRKNSGRAQAREANKKANLANGNEKQTQQQVNPGKKRKASEMAAQAGAEVMAEAEEREVSEVVAMTPEPHCLVVLHKIPEKCIHLEPTDDLFLLHTKKFSKKYFLKFEYPQRIKVDAEGCTASFDGSSLTCTFPITQIYDKETGKTLRKKQKTGAVQSPAQAPSLQAPKKRKKAKKSAPAKVEEAQGAQQMNTTSETKKALELIEQVASKVDEKQKKKIEGEKAKEKFFQEKEQQKEDRKTKRVEQRQKAVAQAKKQLSIEKKEQKEVEELKSKPFKASKVKFSEENQILSSESKKRTSLKKQDKKEASKPEKRSPNKGVQNRKQKK